MKKIYMLALAAILPAQTMAVENDSVYAWGAWEEGIQPAAGPIARITPPPAQRPDVNFRPNENSAFLREAADITIRVPAPPVIPNAPQIPNIVIVASDTPTTPRDQF